MSNTDPIKRAEWGGGRGGAVKTCARKGY